MQMISKYTPVIDVEKCLLMKAGAKLAFDKLMPETDILKRNKKEEATISLHSSQCVVQKV